MQEGLAFGFTDSRRPNADGTFCASVASKNPSRQKVSPPCGKPNAATLDSSEPCMTGPSKNKPDFLRIDPSRDFLRTVSATSAAARPANNRSACKAAAASH
jgi:hypothetical protein